MKICFHSHCFPDSLAPRAVAALAENAKTVGMTPHTDGTAAGTLRYLQGFGIDTAMICNIATNPHQERKVNDFAISLAESGKLFAAGSIHPESEDPEGEMEAVQVEKAVHALDNLTSTMIRMRIIQKSRSKRRSLISMV